ncbi:MAG: hypothetical protein IPL40_02585 [Proteobacteria bacterium]|nr:hypothetical protein [Pseudomonadota bacterium]
MLHLAYSRRALLVLALGGLGACWHDGAVRARPDAGSEAARDGTSADAPRGSDARAAQDAAGAGADASATVDLTCLDADPTLTAHERAMIQLPADSWATAPNTALFDLCRAAATYGDGVYLVGGCANVVGAWGGGAYDPIHRKMLLWGGGHNDYGGNELYAFDLPSWTWEQLTEPSRPPFNEDPLADGQPVSRHTYDGLQYLTHANRFFAAGGSRSTDGAGTRLTWTFELATKIWTNQEPSGSFLASSPYSWATAYDPTTRLLFLHAQAGLNSYDFATNTWTQLINFGFPPYTGKYDGWGSRRGLVDTKRGLFVTLGGGSQMLVYDLAQGKVASLDAAWTVTGGAALEAAPAPGADYDPQADALVAWIGGAPYVLELKATPRAWVRTSAANAPLAQVATGTFGRWRYLAKYNVFLLINDARGDVVFYKHTAGCGI